jgi:hypothetical protein
MSIGFIILGATYQKLWVFENFKRSLGMAGMCWSQWERVDHMCPKRGVRVWKRGISCLKKGARAVGHGLQSETAFFLCIFIFIFIFYFFFGSLEIGLGFWENGYTTPPIFWNLPPTLGSIQSSIPHGAWRFHFFSNFFC